MGEVKLQKERAMSTTLPLNLGVIGLGRMGQIFARHLARRGEGVRLAAISSTRPEAAAHFTRDLAGVKTYVDYHDLLADPQIDAVVIATSTHSHHDVVIAAAQAGKPTFCEKPLALTLAETDAMQRAVTKAGVLFQVGFMRRFDAGYAAAKRQIEAGVIGRPVAALAISRDPNCPDPAFADPANSGGLILDLAIHDIDILRWLMNDEVERVYAEGSLLTCSELAAVGDIDSAVITLRFASGALATIDACRNCRYGYDIRAEIRGSEGTLQIGYLRETPILALTPQGVTHDVVPWFAQRFTPAYNAQLDHFVDCVRHERVPRVGLEDGRRALQIAIAATRSHQTGLPVRVDEVVA